MLMVDCELIHSYSTVPQSGQPLRKGDGALVADIAGVDGGAGLDQQHFAFALGERLVLDAAGDDEEFTFLDMDDTVAETHGEPAFHYQKEFVFVFMVVPDEFAEQLDGLHLDAVDVGHDAGLPVVVEAGEDGAEAHLADREPVGRAVEGVGEDGALVAMGLAEVVRGEILGGAQVGAAQVRAQQIDAEQACADKVCVAQVSRPEVSATQVGHHQVGVGQQRAGKVCHGEIGAPEVGAAEVRAGAGILLAPGVPRVDILDQLQMLRVGHETYITLKVR